MSQPKNFWLMKTEPEVFSFEDLCKAKNRTAPWEGVRNYQARNFMRDQFKKGDQVFIYHSSTKIPGIAGIAEVVKEAYPDPTALNAKSIYFDELSSKRGASRWSMVDVRATAAFTPLIPLTQLRETKGLEKMPLLQRGQRLSIQPVSPAQWCIICDLGNPISIQRE